MKIAFNTSHSYIKNTYKTNFTSLNKAPNDTFVKNAKIDPAQSAFQEHVREIYDKTFDEVIKLNPIAEKLNIKKPTLLFDYEHSDATAVYNFSSNTINLSKAIKEDWFVVSVRGLKEEDAPICVLHKNAMKEQKEEIKKFNCSTKKLNPKEKDFVLSALLAHELRHCIQTHIVASTKSTSQTTLKHYKRNYRKDYIIGCEIRIIDWINRLLFNKKHPKVKSTLNLIKLSKYSKNYKPQTLLEDDTSLKFSIRKQDKRYWSTKKHLFPAEMSALSQIQDIEYISNPLEIDANNFEYEYIYTKLRDSNEKPCRKNVAIALSKNTYKDFATGLKHLREFGYPPLVKKSN